MVSKKEKDNGGTQILHIFLSFYYKSQIRWKKRILKEQTGQNLHTVMPCTRHNTKEFKEHLKVLFFFSVTRWTPKVPNRPYWLIMGSIGFCCFERKNSAACCAILPIKYEGIRDGRRYVHTAYFSREFWCVFHIGIFVKTRVENKKVTCHLWTRFPYGNCEIDRSRISST